MGSKIETLAQEGDSLVITPELLDKIRAGKVSYQEIAGIIEGL